MFFRKGKAKKTIQTEVEGYVFAAYTGAKSQNTTDYVENWYKHHIYTAITTIMDAVKKKEWQVLKGDKPATEKTPILGKYIKVLKNPNEQHTWADMISLIVASLESTGNAYVMKFPDARNVQKLYFLQPNKVQIIQSKDRAIAGYRIYMGSGKTVDVAPDLIIHFRYPNLADPYGYGIGPFQAATGHFNRYEYVTEYEGNLLNNIGVPPLVLKFGETAEQGQRLLAKWREAYSGYKNAGKTAVIPKKADIEQLGFSPSDLNFTDIKKLTREDIYMIFKVPQLLVGVTEKVNRANMHEAQVAFEEFKIFPLCRMLEREYTKSLFTGTGAEFKFILQSPRDYETELKRHELYLREGVLSPNEVRAEIGRQPYLGGDDIYRNISQIVVATVRAMKSLEAGKKEVNIKKGIDGEKIWKGYIRWQGRFEKELEKEAHKYFKWLGKKIASNISSLEPKGFKSDILDIILLEPEALAEEMSKRFNSHIQNVQNMAIDMFVANYGVDLVVDPSLDIARYIDNLHETWKGIAQTDIEQLKGIIRSGIDDGKTMQEIAREIVRRYNPDSGDYMNAHRARTIARTETGKAANDISHNLLEENFSSRQWFTALDERTRDWHVEAHGQIARKGEKYIVGGEELAFPGDPAGSPWNVINCRCIEIPAE